MALRQVHLSRQHLRELCGRCPAATERLIEQLQPQLMGVGLSASVVQLPQGQDADGLIRSQGPTAVEYLIASARHWLEWRLDRLLVPLDADVDPPTLESLQAVEQSGKALLEQLPDGVLRRSADQRLDLALRGSGEQNPGTLPPAGAVVEPCVATVRLRAERRALRLYVYAPECRTLLQRLDVQDPACLAAMKWLNSLADLAMNGPIAGIALELSSRVPGVWGQNSPTPQALRLR